MWKGFFRSLLPARRPAVPQPRRTRLRLEVLEDRTAPAIVSWAGAAGGLWSVPANWAGGATPGAADTVILGKNTSSQDDIAGLSITNLSVQPTYNSTLTLAQDLTVTGGISMLAGKIDGAAKTLSLTGAASTFTWSAGEIASKVALGKNGTNPTLNIMGAVILSSTLFDSFATTTWTAGGDLTMSNGSNFTNEVGGTFDVQNNQTVAVAAGNAASFSNAGGTFKKSMGAGTTQIQASFTTIGPLLAGSGNIYFKGLFTQNAGGVITLNGGSLQTSGILNLAGGQLVGVGTITGNVSNSGKVTPGLGGVPGTINIVGGNYTQNAAGELVINVSAAGIGLLNVQKVAGFGGNVDISGTLTVNRNAAYAPPLGTVLTFLTYVTDTGGDFTTVNYLPNNAWNNGGARSFSKTANGTADQLTVI